MDNVLAESLKIVNDKIKKENDNLVRCHFCNKESDIKIYTLNNGLYACNHCGAIVLDLLLQELRAAYYEGKR